VLAKVMDKPEDSTIRFKDKVSPKKRLNDNEKLKADRKFT